MKFLTTLLGATLLLFSSNSRADLIYLIDIDTRALTGTGLIELSLGGLAEAPIATALVSSDNAVFGEVVDQFGDSSGDLTTSLLLASSFGLADLLQQVSFGDVLRLQVQFAGDWFDAIGDSGLSFAIKLWSEQFESLLTDDESGDLVRLELQPGGLVDIQTLSTAVSVQPLISIPAPAVASLLLVGAALLGMQRRRQH